MISNCGSDENKKYHGGKAGDQTGGEWNIRTWYNRPWLGVFRHPDVKVRDMIADMAKKSAENNNIGYDQWQRTTYWSELKAVKFIPEKIANKCEADCSSGVAAIVKAVGYRLGIKKLQDVSELMYTGNEKSILTKAGFTFLSEAKYLTSDEYLMPGDILFYDNRKNNTGHTAINLDYGSKIKVVAEQPVKPVPTPAPSPAPTVKPAENSKCPYLARVSITDLRIRTGPGTNYPMVMKNGGVLYTGIGTFTIMEEKSGQGSKAGWGRLKSGAGWISLDYAKKV